MDCKGMIIVGMVVAYIPFEFGITFVSLLRNAIGGAGFQKSRQSSPMRPCPMYDMDIVPVLNLLIRKIRKNVLDFIHRYRSYQLCRTGQFTEQV